MLLLTRPYPESLEMGASLKKMNIPFFIEPMLKVVPLKTIIVRGVQTLIVTSRNALDCLGPLPKDMDVYCVGEALGDVLRKNGILSVQVFPSVVDLVAHIQNQPPSNFGSILYAAGKSKTIEIENILKPLGYAIATEVLYQTETPKALTDDLVALLKDKTIATISFFSKKTATAFMHLMHSHKLEHLYPSLSVLVFSDSIRETLKRCPWKKILITKEPSMNSFWQLIKNHVGC